MWNWWRQRKGLRKKTGAKERQHEGTEIGCQVHYLTGSNKTLGLHKCSLLARCPVWPIMTLEVIPEVLRKQGEGHWLSKQLRSLVANTGRLTGLNHPNMHFMRPSQRAPDVSPSFPGPLQTISHYHSKLKQLLPGLSWPTKRKTPRVVSRKRGQHILYQKLQPVSQGSSIWPQSIILPFFVPLCNEPSFPDCRDLAGKQNVGDTLESAQYFSGHLRIHYHSRNFSESMRPAFQGGSLWKS